jgi:hypothetical protein
MIQRHPLTKVKSSLTDKLRDPNYHLGGTRITLNPTRLNRDELLKMFKDDKDNMERMIPNPLVSDNDIVKLNERDKEGNKH